ncbi:MAG: Ig-like domain-containing protein [Cytophagales bacterium]
MKNFTKTKNVIVALVALALTSASVSCRPNNANQPQPQPQTQNQTPTVSASYSNGVITANASDNDGTITKVEFFNGDSLVYEDFSSPFECPVNNLSAGTTYTYIVKTTDNSGATSQYNITFTIPNTNTGGGNTGGGVDTSNTGNGNTGGGSVANPVVTLDIPTIVQCNTLNFTVTATDADGIAKVEIFENNTLLQTINSTPYNVSLTNLSIGSHTYTVIVTDTKNATTTTTATVEIQKTPKEITIELMSAFLNKPLRGIVGNTTLTTSTITTTAQNPIGGFFTAGVASGTYNYAINDAGQVTFITGSIQTTYSVQVDNNILVFTDQNRTNKIYSLFE